MPARCENRTWTPHEHRRIREQIKALLERLWRTGEIFLEKPDVASERRNAMHYLTDVFPQVLPLVDARFREAWAEAGFPASFVEAPAAWPRISFGLWVGGDRDGHPLVTASVTADTLRELRSQAITLLEQHLVTLARRLSLSELLQPPPDTLRARLEQRLRELGPAGEDAVARNPGEPWRQFANTMLARLPRASGQASAAAAAAYSSPAALLDDLDRVDASLRAVGAARRAAADVRPLMRLVQAFGFHLATLDIRQNSAFHDRALMQLAAAAGVDAVGFDMWSEADRLRFVMRELESPRPFVREGQRAGDEADAVLDCYRVLRSHLDAHGRPGIGPLIVSMTRSVSDLLVVYLLARDAGLLMAAADGPVCALPVVPLFETIEDLERSPAILEQFLAHPITRRTLSRLRPVPTQQVMIGYSDSNQDGGTADPEDLVGLSQRHRFQSGRNGALDIWIVGDDDVCQPAAVRRQFAAPPRTRVNQPRVLHLSAGRGRWPILATRGGRRTVEHWRVRLMSGAIICGTARDRIV